MEAETWITYLIACIFICISPGSGAVLAMSHGTLLGWRRTLFTIAGLEAGGAVILLLAGVGVGSVLLASGFWFGVIKVIGALYLIWLGLAQWRSAGTQSQVQAGHSSVPTTRLFMTGFATNVSNPKGIIFMVAILPQFINQALPLVPQLALMALTMTLVDMLVMTTYAYSANRLQQYLRSPSAQRIQSRFFGGVLMAMGAALLMVKNQAAD